MKVHYMPVLSLWRGIDLYRLRVLVAGTRRLHRPRRVRMGANSRRCGDARMTDAANKGALRAPVAPTGVTIPILLSCTGFIDRSFEARWRLVPPNVPQMALCQKPRVSGTVAAARPPEWCPPANKALADGTGPA